MNRRRAQAFAAITTGVTLFGTALTFLVTGSAHAEAPPGAGFLSIYLTAEAGGERVVATGAVNTVGDGATEMDVPFAQAQLLSSSQHALSSAAWPGSLAGDLGSFLLLSSSQAPKQSTVLNDPVRAEAPTPSGQTTVQNNTVPGLSMTSTATPTDVVADALMGGSEQAEVGSYGTTHVTSTARLTGPTAAETTADSVTQDLQLGPTALVTIASVRSHAEVTTDGAKSIAKGSTTVTGMTVAGFPVAVDQDGVHSTGKGPSAKAANAAINKALAQSQTQIFLTEPQQTTSPVGTTYEASNLLMSFDGGGFYIEVGGARAVAGSTAAAGYTPPSGPPPPPVTSGAPPLTNVSAQLPPSGTGALAPAAPTNPLPQTAPAKNAPAPQLAANPLQLPGGGLAPGWLVAVLLGAGLIAFGLSRLPDRLLEHVPTPCPLGENT